MYINLVAFFRQKPIGSKALCQHARSTMGLPSDLPQPRGAVLLPAGLEVHHRDDAVQLQHAVAQF